MINPPFPSPLPFPTLQEELLVSQPVIIKLFSKNPQEQGLCQSIINSCILIPETLFPLRQLLNLARTTTARKQDAVAVFKNLTAAL